MAEKRRFLLLGLFACLLSFLSVANRAAGLEFAQIGEATGSEYFLLFDVSEEVTGEEVVFFDLRDGANYRAVHFWNGGVFIEQIADATRATLASGDVPPTKTGELLLKHHADYVAVVLNGKILCSTDISKSEGRGFGLGSDGKGFLSFRRIQPLEQIYFSDSFMRTDNAGEWNLVSGHWEICGLSFADRSTNPFSLFARFNDSDKLESLSAGRLLEEKTGVGVNMTPDGQIVRIAGQAPAAQAGLQEDDIIRTVNGKPIYMMWQLLEDATDGERFDLVVNRGGAEFKVTIYARKYRWGEVEKRYPLDGSEVAPMALLTTGFPFWDDYTFRASVRPAGEGMAGMVFCWRSPRDYMALRWWGDNSKRGLTTNQLEVVEIQNGVEKSLWSRKGGFFADQYYDMKVQIERNKVRIFVDQQMLTEIESAYLSAGKIGLAAETGYGVYFDDVVVASSQSFKDYVPKRKVNEIYRQQGDMREWSDPVLDWKSIVINREMGYRNNYSFFGPTEVTVNPELKYSELKVLGFADEMFDGGCMIRINRTEGRGSVSAGDFSREYPKIPLRLDLPYAIRFERDRVRVVQGEETLFSTGLPNRLSGNRFAVYGVRNIYASGKSLLSISGLDNEKDYTFEQSPTDWFVNDGKWGVMNKWICDPRWSFFGGVNTEGSASITSKYDLEGDFTADCFFATMMLVDDPPYEMIGNYAMTVLDNGEDLDTGYSLIIGGDMNAWTGVAYKGSVIEKVTRGGLLPVNNRLRFMPNEVVHQRWFHMQAVKTGKTLNLFFEGQLVKSIPDVSDTTGKRVSLWVYRNGWMISRVRIAAEKFKACEPKMNFEEHLSAGGWSDGEERRVRFVGSPDDNGKKLNVKLQENGKWVLHSDLQEIDLGATPELRFSARLDNGLMGDIYFDYQEKSYRIRITGPLPDDPGIPSVGSLEWPNDGKMHTIAVPVARMLRSYMGKQTFGRISNLRFGQLCAEGFILTGFGGNKAGLTFSLLPMEAVPVATQSIVAAKALLKGKAEILLDLAEGCATPDFSKMTVERNGRVIAAGESAYLSPDGKSLVIPIMDVLSLDEGSEFTAKVAGLRTLDGAELPSVIVGPVKYSVKDDKSAPQIVRCSVGAEPIVHLDFELPFGPKGTPAQRDNLFGGVQRDSSSAFMGRFSLKLFSGSIGSLMMYRLYEGPINIRKSSIIEMSYLMKEDVPLSLLLGGSEYSIGFNDPYSGQTMSYSFGKETYSSRGEAGRFQKPIIDGKWHTASAIIDPSSLRGDTFNGLTICDLGFRGCYINDFINIDEVKITSWSAKPEKEPTIVVSECGTIAETFSSMSLVPEEPSGVWLPSAPIPAGTQLYYNVKVRDSAGNWSETRHFRFYCDSEPPMVRRLRKADNGAFRITFGDASPLDAGSLKITVDGKVLTGKPYVIWESGSVALISVGNLQGKKAYMEIRDAWGNLGRFRIENYKATALDKAEEL